MTYEDVTRNDPLITIKRWSWEVLKKGFSFAFLLTSFFKISLLFIGTKISTAVIIAVPLFLLLLMVFSRGNYPIILMRAFNDWENNYIIPYIQSSPEQKAEKLNTLDIRTYFYNGKALADVEFIYNKEIYYKGANVRIAENITKPYLTFYVCDNNFQIRLNSNNRLKLVNDYKKGELYFLTLHIPSDYEFGKNILEG